MQAAKNSSKPSIMIYAAMHPALDAKLREVQAGIEEEGVPYVVSRSEEQNATGLSYQAAGQSQLGVGVGIGPEAICVHYIKLPAGEPLFSTGGVNAPDEWRRCGYNAARLVKGIPFKDKQDLSAAPPLEAQDDLHQLVREIVTKVLQEQAPGR